MHEKQGIAKANSDELVLMLIMMRDLIVDSNGWIDISDGAKFDGENCNDFVLSIRVDRPFDNWCKRYVCTNFGNRYTIEMKQVEKW